jgi:hypothetical protein
MKLIDLTGQRFGRLVVIGPSQKRFHEQACWVCRCICGKRHVVPSHNLRKGNTTSCGCYLRDIRSTIRLTHGRTHTTEYKTWLHMRERCYNPKDNSYKYCGGLGVTVAPEWRQDFAAFFRYMGPKPTPIHSVDRWPDPWGNYEPGNVRWATPSEQVRNLRLYHPRP